ncbi:MarR family winged helix-turn-helix transcriptional regulator [Pelagibacterium flavum]|uniref:MarR family winged helix-turn-helix transcriptional regulator n=1 Tax=Pelagibacterium flavum TaxID=2984530 RepID=A0ABY6IKB1_9HYPH|nr:MarR family winged helix-turn-helix transcriptional regulator [Pelagibacterium sp. YIM 151497]UYQ71031.1 MarR family winged helix-turn-helix transcriptional regulator [Pelagibacterium sp. YIM 151497]|eukprot:jgi/Tetstr1/450508/TSEL_037544.t1
MPTRQDTLRDLLTKSGKDAGLADALIRIDNVVQNWRRQMHKRELGHRATRALGLDMDMAQIDVLFAIAHPMFAPDTNADDETMVSTVAERLHIDPSRASRLVAEMVNSGYARRAVSQRDARRTILELTPAGEAVIDAVRGYKWLLLGEFFSGWSPEDVATFVPLLERYSSWMNSSEVAEEKFADEIDELAKSIDRARQEVSSGSKSG